MNEYEHQRFRDWEVSCAQKDAAIIQLTAERDALLAAADMRMKQLEQSKAERDALKAELAATNSVFSEQTASLVKFAADEELLRGQIERTQLLASINSDAATRFKGQLTELREAAERFQRHATQGYPNVKNMHSWQWLEAVLAKVKP